MKSAAVRCLGVVTALAGGVRASDPVRPGEIAAFTLPVDSISSVELELPAGTWNVFVDSTEFDVSASLRGDADRVDGDASAGFGERLAVPVPAPNSRVLEVAASDGRAGSFTVRVAAPDLLDAVSPAQELDALEGFASIAESRPDKLPLALVRAFWSSLEWQDLESVDRALALLGDLARTPVEQASVAVLHALKPGPTRRPGSDPVAALEAALDDLDGLLWGMDTEVLVALGRFAAGEGHLEEAREYYDEAARRAAEVGDAAGEAHARLAIARMVSAPGPDGRPRAAPKESTLAWDAAAAALQGRSIQEPARASGVLFAVSSHFWVTGDLARAHAAASAGLRVGIPPQHLLRLQVLLCQVEARQHRFAAAGARVDVIEALIERRGALEQDLGRIEDLSSILFTMGRYVESRRLVDRVLEATRESGGVVRADALMTVALLRETAGEPAAAELAWIDALAELDRVQRPDAAVYGQSVVRIGLGRVQRQLGRFGEAEASFLAALEICDRYSLTTRVAALHGLAEVQLAREELDAARESMLPVVAAYRANRDHDALFAAWETLGRIELARGAVGKVEELLDGADRRLEEAEVLGAWGAAGVRSRYADFARLAQDLTARLSTEAASDEARARVVEAGFRRAGDWKARALLARLQGQGAAARSGADAIATLRAALGPGRVMIEYAGGRDRLYGYRLDERGLSFHDLGSRAALEEAVRAYREEVLVSATLRDPALLAERGRSLYDRLLGPLVGPTLPGRLVIVPEGILATLPFEALVLDRGEDAKPTLGGLTFVLDRVGISYASSVPVLATMAGRARPPLAEGRALLLGDAVMPQETGETADEFGPFVRLKRTREECVVIADLYLPSDENDGGARRDELGRRSLASRRNPEPLADPRFDLVLGRAASPARVTDHDLAEYAVLHLATHGYVDSADPARSGLVLSPDSAGARVLDVARIRELSGLRGLVVLSACETARGPLLRGEGVQSIGSAFLEAGARGVVASLWPVDDERTRALMEGFYRELLLKGSSPAVGLDAARRELRHRRGVARGLHVRDSKTLELEFAHPSVWAPFVYWGQVE